MDAILYAHQVFKEDEIIGHLIVPVNSFYLIDKFSKDEPEEIFSGIEAELRNDPADIFVGQFAEE